MYRNFISVSRFLAEQVPKFQPSVICCTVIIDLLLAVDLSFLGSSKTRQLNEVKPQEANASHLSGLSEYSHVYLERSNGAGDNLMM